MEQFLAPCQKTKNSLSKGLCKSMFLLLTYALLTRVPAVNPFDRVPAVNLCPFDKGFVFMILTHAWHHFCPFGACFHQPVCKHEQDLKKAGGRGGGV